MGSKECVVKNEVWPAYEYLKALSNMDLHILFPTYPACVNFTENG